MLREGYRKLEPNTIIDRVRRRTGAAKERPQRRRTYWRLLAAEEKAGFARLRGLHIASGKVLRLACPSQILNSWIPKLVNLASRTPIEDLGLG